MQALVSIHDLMPETMDQVETILVWLKERSVPPATLLIVPGKPWSVSQIDRLRKLADHGHTLAAHGWHHHTHPRKLYHRIHARLISRNVAEHLDLDSQNVLGLLHRSREWFRQNALPLPDFYVPPAWALGSISPADLAAAPFQMIETTRGILFLSGVQKPRFEKLPLTGYEADTSLREFFLRHWNSSQARKAIRTRKPLRISIHPNDLQLHLTNQLDQQIRNVKQFIDYTSL